MNLDLTPESHFTHSKFIHPCKSGIRPYWVLSTFGAPLTCLELDLGGPLLVKRKVSDIRAHPPTTPWIRGLVTWFTEFLFFLRELSYYEKDTPSYSIWGHSKPRKQRKHFPHAKANPSVGRWRGPPPVAPSNNWEALVSWELKMRSGVLAVVWRQHLVAVSVAWLWLVQTSSCAGSLVPIVMIEFGTWDIRPKKKFLGYWRYALRVPSGTPVNPRSFFLASGFSCDLLMWPFLIDAVASSSSKETLARDRTEGATTFV